MKIFICLFVLICAVHGITSNPDISDDSLEWLNPKSINNNFNDEYSASDEVFNFLQRVLKLAKDIQDKVKNIITDASTKAIGFANSSEELLIDEQKLIEKQLEQLSIADCFEGKREEIRAVIAKAKEQIADCLKNVSSQVNEFQEKVREFEKQIGIQVRDIQGIMGKCSESGNPISTVACVVKNMNKINAAVNVIMANVKDALHTAILDLASIGLDTRKCILNVLLEAREQLKIIAQEIVECIKQNKP